MNLFASMSPLQVTLLEVASPLLAIILVLLVAKFRHLSWRENLGLILPRPSQATGSVILPMLMHIAWNLYAVW